MKNLLITSPAGYAQRFLNAYAELGCGVQCKPISVPMIQTDIYTDSEDFRTFIRDWETFDYVAFSSRKAIEAFAEFVVQHGLVIPFQLKCCAIGKDNELLESALHVRPVFISREPSPKGIVNELAEINDIVGRKIAVLAPQVIGMEEPNVVPDFIQGLQDIGMDVARVTAYQTRAVSADILKKTKERILQGELSGIVFTSGTEIKVFLRMIPQDTSVDEFLQDITIICYGPYTAAYAKRLGIKVDYTSTSFGSFNDFVKKIEEFFQG